MYPENMQPHHNPQDSPSNQQAFSDAAFEALLTRSLEHTAQPQVPADFAARVRSALPPPPRPRHTAQVARLAAIAAAMVLAIALFILAPHTAPTFANFAFDLELLAIAQLGGIGYWLTVRKGA